MSFAQDNTALDSCSKRGSLVLEPCMFLLLCPGTLHTQADLSFRGHSVIGFVIHLLTC